MNDYKIYQLPSYADPEGDPRVTITITPKELSAFVYIGKDMLSLEINPTLFS